MTEHKQHVLHTKGYVKILRLVMILIAIAFATTLLAYGWQKYDENKYPEGTEKNYKLPNAFVNFAQLITDFIDEHNNKQEETEKPDNQIEAKKNGNDTIMVVGGENENTFIIEEEIPNEVISIGGIVEETEAAGDYDFRNDLFIGDWFVYGFSNTYFKSSKFAYATGYDFNAFTTKKIFEADGKNFTAIDYIKSMENVSSVYIMFSPESVSWMDCQTFVKKYTAFLNDVKEAIPKAYIYVQPILPILTEETKKREYSVTNEKIEEINGYILDFCDENDLWYLDMTEIFKDEGTGEMLSEYTTNGIRLTEEAYTIWYDYLKLHKVK